MAEQSLPAVKDISDPSKARVVVYQDGRMMHAPLSASGLLSLSGGTMTGPLTSNGQIVFPATANPSAGANTLDDYEEGIWTPIYVSVSGAFGAITYDSLRFGRYTRIGRQVFIHGGIRTDSLAYGTAGTSQVTIGGLPFVNAGPSYAAVAIPYSHNYLVTVPIGGLIVAGTTAIYLYYRNAPSTISSLQSTAHMSTSADDNYCYFLGHYEA